MNCGLKPATLKYNLGIQILLMLCYWQSENTAAKKTKNITEEEKQKYKAYFKDKEGVFIIQKLACDIIEHCKLPEPIKLRKKLGYIHNNIMIHDETSIAEKIIELFPHKNIVLNKKFNNRKPDIWFKNHNLIIEVDEGNHENYDSDDENKREDMFKKTNFKIFRCNPNDPNFNLYKFLGEINLHISKLCKENAANKEKNKAINKIETICQKHFTKIQKMKNTQSKIKAIKIKKPKKTPKNLEHLIVLGAKILSIILGQRK